MMKKNITEESLVHGSALLKRARKAYNVESAIDLDPSFANLF